MSMLIHADLLIADIRTGKYDDNLEAIYNAALDRRKYLREQVSRDTFMALAKGDRVRIKQCNPKYMIGVTARVTDFRTKKITIMAEEGQFLGRFSPRIVLDPSMVEKIPEKPSLQPLSNSLPINSPLENEGG